MSKTHIPGCFNGEVNNFYDPNFTFEINKRMRVPKCIKVNGDCVNDNAVNGSTWSQTNSADKLEMHVPDRILVVGQEQHVGTKAPPREITLENAVMPSESHTVRVQTPPRILTLDDHYFPTADEDESELYSNDSKEPIALKSRAQFNTETQIVKHTSEPIPSYSVTDVSLPPSEEVQHLRRQVGKLNRRVMAIELEMLQRQQRDKILYTLTVAYFILKVFSWLNRN